MYGCHFEIDDYNDFKCCHHIKSGTVAYTCMLNLMKKIFWWKSTYRYRYFFTYLDVMNLYLRHIAHKLRATLFSVDLKIGLKKILNEREFWRVKVIASHGQDTSYINVIPISIIIFPLCVAKPLIRFQWNFGEMLWACLETFLMGAGFGSFRGRFQE